MSSSDEIFPLIKHNPLRVLVVEGNALNKKVLLQLLKYLGCKTESVSRLPEIQGTCQIHRQDHQFYDVLLVDLQLLQTASSGNYSLLPLSSGLVDRPKIIAMVEQPSDRAVCFEIGVDDCLYKPIQLDDLKQALEKCLPVPANQQEAKAQPTPLDHEVLQALQNMGGKEHPEVFIEIVRTYLVDAPNLLQAIQTAIVQQQADQLKSAAHSLKSISAALGATVLSNYCKDLEVIGRSGDVDQAVELRHQLNSEFERVRVALEAECQRSLL